MTENYDILSQNTQSTVVAEYEQADRDRESSYQSEQDLERDLIARLQRQGYEYLPIHNESELIVNLRRQLEVLNNIRFTDGEWQRFFKTEIANESKGIREKAFTIQRDYKKSFVRDDGTQVNINLIDKKDIHHNITQVINQYAENSGSQKNRYDVTILVNGLPLVHIELKRRGVLLKEAFNQINRYGRESFWADNALFEYVQIFIISNGTETKYYSNTTRDNHIKEQTSKAKSGRQRTCNSYEFTSYWSDARNKLLNDLEDFTATFLSRHSLLSILTRFCVLTEQQVLMAMRPYQIAATERLLNRIEVAHNARLYGTIKAGGYIWHTTGSGKTLTSFKAAQLATQLPYIDKVFFVVDRKDLDYQTMREYDRFQKGAANGNTSTKVLEGQIANAKSRIIITTIQKLTTFIKNNPNSDIYQKEVVMIFDECHRSQFGDMHQIITKRFRKYYLFGFTGTPIFAENMPSGAGLIKTTEDAFGERLHTYTIVNAISDHNVLPFRVDYVRTMKEKEEMENSKVWDIEREKALSDPRRISLVAKYILEHYAQQTLRGRNYRMSVVTNVTALAKDKKKKVEEERAKSLLSGFNSIFAVQNIPMAKAYYLELQQQMQPLPEDQRLRMAIIYSYAANEADPEEGEENNDNTEGLDASSREFLERAIKEDYNPMFGTSYDTSADKFPNYYKDVSLRMKNREIDILVVVNMFLTGFDATTLNTLWVDKNLRYHGLLQSYSRTNRILNSIKTFGNIVCFRNLEDATNKALSLFGDPEARGVSILRPFEDYFNGYEDKNGLHQKGYRELIEELLESLKPGELPVGEQAEKEFIKLFGIILKMRNLLSVFDDFPPMDMLSERDVQDYTSIYLDLAEKYRGTHKDKADICDDVVFEMELVKQVEVNIDFILFLVEQYRKTHKQDAEIRVKISKAIDSSPDLRDKKELIEQFIEQLTPNSEVDAAWRIYVNNEKRRQFETIVEEEHLKREKAVEFIENAYARGYVPEGGMELDGIMPPINPFDPSANRQGKIQRVVDRLKAFFSRFFSIADNRFGDSSDEEETVSENISVNYFGKETDEETDYPMAADETKLDYH
jgi:type I restriction enzyme R subunit